MLHLKKECLILGCGRPSRFITGLWMKAGQKDRSHLNFRKCEIHYKQTTKGLETLCPVLDCMTISRHLKPCGKHRCQIQKCHNVVVQDSRFCDYHQNPLCAHCRSPCLDRFSYCAEHKCKATGCPNERDTCSHKCDVKNCSDNKHENFDYCRFHLCYAPNCPNERYSCFHKCSYHHCGSPKHENLDVCLFHDCSTNCDYHRHHSQRCTNICGRQYCLNRKKEGKAFCQKHLCSCCDDNPKTCPRKCQTDECLEPKDDGEPFCKNHSAFKCETFACQNKQVVGSKFCIIHKCPISDDCMNEHRCQVHACRHCFGTLLPKLEGFNYCAKHKCKVEDCDGDYTCRLHQCQFSSCLNPPVANRRTCLSHCCPVVGCSGDKLCPIHTCECCGGLKQRKPTISQDPILYCDKCLECTKCKRGFKQSMDPSFRQNQGEDDSPHLCPKCINLCLKQCCDNEVVKDAYYCEIHLCHEINCNKPILHYQYCRTHQCHSLLCRQGSNWFQILFESRSGTLSWQTTRRY